MLSLRDLDEADAPILSQATLLNVNWSGERLSMHDVQNDPRLADYTKIVPERGDFGFVLHDHTWVSVVWLLFLDHRDPGFGFVRDGVPELSVSTQPGHRGVGHGRRLISHVIDTARSRRLPAISLSVEAGNPAARLYERLGFTPVPDAPTPGTALLGLT